MEEKVQEGRFIEEKEPFPFTSIVDIEDRDFKAEQNCEDNAASTTNPRKNSDKRLFQERITDFSWDPCVDYNEQPNRLEVDGPTDLL